MAYKPVSESAIYAQIRSQLENAAIFLSSDDPAKTHDAIRGARELLDQLDAQVTAGIHKNPMLVTFNPPVVKIASDVQGILYRHAKDGEFFFHSFGGEEVEFRNMGGGKVMIDQLPGRTGIEAFLVRDKRNRTQSWEAILRHKDGKPIAEDV